MKSLPCPHILQLEPYMSARRIGGNGKVWLNANELPFARMPYPLDESQYHRYPDHLPDLLHQKYAEYCQLQPEQVLALRGADEAIDLLIRSYCRASIDSIVTSSPTYGMYEVCGQIQDAQVCDIPLTEDFELNLAQLKQTPPNTKLVFVCNPNNPTGNAFSRQSIIELIEYYRDRALVVIDEAYIEFCPEQSLVGLLKRYPHLVIIRTLSKAFGLAGVHVGFALANSEVMETLRKVAAPYPLADPCAQIALSALENNAIDMMQRQVDEIKQTRQLFVEQLSLLANVVQVFPSQTNFVLVEFAEVKSVWETLVSHYIIARQIPHQRLERGIRFTIGSIDEMKQVIEVLKQ